jgi:hypothetical protein
MRSYYLGPPEDAVRSFNEAAQRDPQCAMICWALSRAYVKAGQNADALAAQAKAEALASSADDREQRLITAWGKMLKASGLADPGRKNLLTEARSDLDLAIALYPDDVEAWLLRADAAESPLRAGPFTLEALRLQPGHPLAQVWKPTVPPPPDIQPSPTQPVKALEEKPPLFEGLGMLSYPVTTRSAQAQAYFEQGLRLWHGYVAPGRVKNSAAASFQYAANLDPDCAMAYWGLSFCETGAMSQLNAANRSLELALKTANDRERRMAAARVMEQSAREERDAANRALEEAQRKGNAGEQEAARARQQAAGEKQERFLDALDGLIAAYPEDVELWVWRGRFYTNYSLGGDVKLPCFPYQLAAHRMHPEHPSPNHEMIHGYEAIDRPALGWPFTEGFRRSAPNLPHANHMQAHLAMRLGRWQEAIDCTRMSRKKSLEGYPELDATHHIDILVRALGHEGRFQEAEAEPKAYRDGLAWARLLQLKADPRALEEWAERRRADKAADGFYIGALAKLNAGDAAAAAPLVTNVEEQWKKVPAVNFYRYNEVKGRYLVQTGSPDEGLKLLREAADKAVKDNALHAWGGGSYMLEVWGEASLRVHRWDEAEQAFLEALAHEHGSIVGALGMQVVSEATRRPDLAAHYAARAAAIWKDADPGARERQLERLRKLASGSVASSGGGK